MICNVNNKNYTHTHTHSEDQHFNHCMWCFLHLTRQTRVEISSQCHDCEFPPQNLSIHK